jgi:hypothetical protein
MVVPDGQALKPVSVQQNSVYPSQQDEPQSHEVPEHPQMAAYAVVGRSRKVVGATAIADPTTAERATNPRRDIFGSSAFASRSTTRVRVAARAISRQ